MIRLVIDDRGLVVSLVDLAGGREVIPAGMAGNLLQVHRDTPNEWDAWDVDDHYRRAVVDLDLAESLTVSADRRRGRRPGRPPVRGVHDRAADHPRPRSPRRVEFTTIVDWHERQTTAQAGLPARRPGRPIGAETQFGHVFRPTHTNTSWEAAKFEICAHRWIHVAEPGFGVAIANDRTYGHDVTSTPASGSAGDGRAR